MSSKLCFARLGSTENTDFMSIKNQEKLKERLNELLDNEESKMIYGFIDIDDFGIFNAKNGFESGNIVIERISEIGQESISSYKWFRLGSDEFLFSFLGELEELNVQIFSFMKNIHDEFQITISVGLVEKRSSRFSNEDLLARLKSSVLLVKMNGKNKLYIT